MSAWYDDDGFEEWAILDSLVYNFQFACLGDQGFDLTVVEDIFQFVRFHGGTEHQEDSTCLQNPEKGNYSLGGAMHKNRNPVTTLNSLVPERASQLIGSSIYFLIGKALVSINNSYFVRVSLGTIFKEVVNQHSY